MFTLGSILRFLLIVVEIISSLLLVGAILIQRTRSQGMGMAFGAGMGESLFGGQVGNVLTRATVIVGVVFLVNTSLLAIVYARMSAEEPSVVDTTPAPAPAAALPMPGGVGEPTASPMASPLATPLAEPVESATPVEIPAAAEPVDAPLVDLPVPEAPAAQPEAPAPDAPAAEAMPAVPPPAAP